MNQSRQTGDPLVRSHLEVVIDGLLATHVLRHVFRNAGSAPIEAVCSFPVPLDAAFLGMEAVVGGKRRVATVQRRDAARASFDAALGDGDTAVLLETPMPGLLCVDLGNLMPGEEGEVVLRFAAALAVAGGRARFSLPLVQRPRYGRGRLDALVEPGHDFAVEHPLEATVRVRGMLADAAVECSSHAARFAREDGGLILDLPSAMLDRDLVLGFDVPADPPLQVQCIADGERTLGVLTCITPARAASQPDAALDLVLLLDCSGSMHGDAIAQSRAALRAVAAELRDHDRIQAVRFGSTVAALFRRPLPATDRVRTALGELAATVHADLGGTDMDAALERALDDLAGLTPGSSRAIILVTDGAVHAHMLAAVQARAAAAGVRVFIVAVGSSAGVDALAPLAEATRGALERAVPAEPVDAGVLRHLRRARQLTPLALAIDWGARATPLPLPTAYAGDAVVAIAALPRAADTCVSLRVDGRVLAPALPVGAARADAALRAWCGQQLWRHAGAEERAEVALRYGLLTPETGAVLVLERGAGEKAEGLPLVQPVPHMLPAGMLFGVQLSRAPKFTHVTETAPRFMRRAQALADEMSGETCLHVEEVGPVPARDAAPSAPASGATVELALLAALRALLLADAPDRCGLERLLTRIAPELRDAVRAWLLARRVDLSDPAAAGRLLLHLLDAYGDATLSAAEIAQLALLEARQPAC